MEPWSHLRPAPGKGVRHMSCSHSPRGFLCGRAHVTLETTAGTRVASIRRGRHSSRVGLPLAQPPSLTTTGQWISHEGHRGGGQVCGQRPRPGPGARQAGLTRSTRAGEAAGSPWAVGGMVFSRAPGRTRPAPCSPRLLPSPGGTVTRGGPGPSPFSGHAQQPPLLPAPWPPGSSLFPKVTPQSPHPRAHLGTSTGVHTP